MFNRRRLENNFCRMRIKIKIENRARSIIGRNRYERRQALRAQHDISRLFIRANVTLFIGLVIALMDEDDRPIAKRLRSTTTGVGLDDLPLELGEAIVFLSMSPDGILDLPWVYVSRRMYVVARAVQRTLLSRTDGGGFSDAAKVRLVKQCVQRGDGAFLLASVRLSKPIDSISSYRLCSRAARKGRLEAFKLLYENDCPWDAWARERFAIDAAAENRLDLLRWLSANGVPWNERALVAIALGAVDGGSLDVLRWLNENACVRNASDTLVVRAITRGHLGVLRWLIKNGCAWNARTSTKLVLIAAGRGRFDVLQWLLKEELLLNEHACNHAAGGCFGLLRGLNANASAFFVFRASEDLSDMSRWMNNKNGSLNELTYAIAASYGRWDVAKWLIETGVVVQVPRAVPARPVREDQRKFFAWLQARGHVFEQ